MIKNVFNRDESLYESEGAETIIRKFVTTLQKGKFRLINEASIGEKSVSSPILSHWMAAPNCHGGKVGRT